MIVIRQFALVELCLTSIYDKFPPLRKRKVMVTAIAITCLFILGIPCLTEVNIGAADSPYSIFNQVVVVQLICRPVRTSSRSWTCSVEDRASSWYPFLRWWASCGVTESASSPPTSASCSEWSPASTGSFAGPSARQFSSWSVHSGF